MEVTYDSLAAMVPLGYEIVLTDELQIVNGREYLYHIDHARRRILFSSKVTALFAGAITLALRTAPASSMVSSHRSRPPRRLT